MKFNLWNVYSPIYDLLRQNIISKFFLLKEIRAIESLILKNDLDKIESKTLDIGSGAGHSLDLVSKYFSDINCIDKSIKMLNLSKRKFPNFKYIELDVLDRNFKNILVSNGKNFDIIFCIGISEYISDIDLLLANLDQVLDKKGYIIFTFSQKNFLNLPRLLAGHKLYLRTLKQVESKILSSNLLLVSTLVTPIQIQILLRKKESSK